MFSEANNAVVDSKPDDDGTPHQQSAADTDNATVIIVPDSNAAAKFTRDGDAGTVDAALSPKADVPSTSADAVVKAEKGAEAHATRAKDADKDQKAEDEKTAVVGVFDLVKFFVCHFQQKYS